MYTAIFAPAITSRNSIRVPGVIIPWNTVLLTPAPTAGRMLIDIYINKVNFMATLVVHYGLWFVIFMTLLFGIFNAKTKFTLSSPNVVPCSLVASFIPSSSAVLQTIVFSLVDFLPCRIFFSGDPSLTVYCNPFPIFFWHLLLYNIDLKVSFKKGRR